MSKKSNHVVSSKSGGWAVKKSGSSRASKVFGTKEEAKKYAVKISKQEKTELYIHKTAPFKIAILMDPIHFLQEIRKISA